MKHTKEKQIEIATKSGMRLLLYACLAWGLGSFVYWTIKLILYVIN